MQSTSSIVSLWLTTSQANGKEGEPECARRRTETVKVFFCGLRGERGEQENKRPRDQENERPERERKAKRGLQKRMKEWWKEMRLTSWDNLILASLLLEAHVILGYALNRAELLWRVWRVSQYRTVTQGRKKQ